MRVLTGTGPTTRKPGVDIYGNGAASVATAGSDDAPSDLIKLSSLVKQVAAHGLQALFHSQCLEDLPHHIRELSLAEIEQRLHAIFSTDPVLHEYGNRVIASFQEQLRDVDGPVTQQHVEVLRKRALVSFGKEDVDVSNTQPWAGWGDELAKDILD